MKKIFIPAVSLLLAGSLMLGGCSCTSYSQLEFNHNFYGDKADQTASRGYKEILVYDVSYTENYGDGLIDKNPVVDDEVVKLDYSNGNLTMTLEVLPTYPTDIPSSDLKDTSKEVYKLTTDFKIDVKYTLSDGQVKDYTDKIYKDVWFYPNGSSFMPIYSVCSYECALLNLTTENKKYVSSTNVLLRETETVYNSATYTVKSVSSSNDVNENFVKDYEYTVQTVVDNAQLLFLARNIEVDSQVGYTMPTVEASYGKAQNLMFRTVENNYVTTLPAINYNGNTYENEQFTLNRYSFAISSAKIAGYKQYICIQKQATQNIPFTALPVIYASPLTSYGTVARTGALVYELKQVTNK